MAITYLALTSTDVAKARALFALWQQDDGELVTHASNDYLTKMLDRTDFHVLVALDGEQVVGGVSAYEMPMYKAEVTELFLYEIGVEQAYRCQGIATRLIQILLEKARAKDLTEMYVGAMAGNHPAEALYKKTGGQEEAVSWYTYKI